MDQATMRGSHELPHGALKISRHSSAQAASQLESGRYHSRMPSILFVHGRELHVQEDRDSIMQRIVSAEGSPIREGGQPAGPLGWIRATDTTSNSEILVQASSIGYVRHA